jgi:hypothetical protein
MKNTFAAAAAMPSRLAITALAAASVFLGSAGSALAMPTLLVDRGLPTANLNSPAGSPRSNTAVNVGAPREFAGDDFQLGDNLLGWNINKLSTWVVGGATDSFLGDLYSSLAFYIGDADGDGMQRLAFSNLSAGSDATPGSGPSISATRVAYVDGSTFDSPEGPRALYRVDFDNLGLHYASNTLVQFGIDLEGGLGTVAHASNAALSGLPQAGADGQYRQFKLSDSIPGTADFTGFACTGQDAGCVGGAFRSDVNVQVFGNRVPEPASWALSGMALLALAATRRRSRPSV